MTFLDKNKHHCFVDVQRRHFNSIAARAFRGQMWQTSSSGGAGSHCWGTNAMVAHLPVGFRQ
jgi:hypothetical protein